MLDAFVFGSAEGLRHGLLTVVERRACVVTRVVFYNV